MIFSLSLEMKTLCMKMYNSDSWRQMFIRFLSSYTKMYFIVLSICGKAGNWGIMLDLLLVKYR